MPASARILVAAIAMLAWLGIIRVTAQPGVRWWVYSYLCVLLALSMLTLILGGP